MRPKTWRTITPLSLCLMLALASMLSLVDVSGSTAATPPTIPSSGPTALPGAAASRATTVTSVGAQATTSVSIVDFAFSPPSVTINVGDTVQWTNTGFTEHNTVRSGMWDSPILAHG